MTSRERINAVELYCGILLSRVSSFSRVVSRDLLSGISVWGIGDEQETVLKRWDRYYRSPEFWKHTVDSRHQTFCPPSMSEMEELFFKLPDRTVHVAGASTRNAIEFVIFQLTSAMIKHSCSIDLMNSFRTSLEHANLFGQIQSEITWLHKYAIREIEIPKWIVQKIFDGRDIRTIKKTVLNHDFIEVGRKLRFAVNYLPHDWTNTVAQLLESTSTASERDELERLLRTADLPNLA